MVNFTGYRVFKCMAEWPMPNIMKQNGAQERYFLFIRYLITLQSQLINRILHEVHGANGVLKAIVQRTGIDKVRQTKLRNAPQTLKPRMIDELQNKRMADGNESIDRVVDDFTLECQEKILDRKNIYCGAELGHNAFHRRFEQAITPTQFLYGK